ncbi:MAG TPA: replicative DNA helicase [Steroidobacteraceae bacterium]|jgi:replicative DNA helicase|nr:replicative DNA helicase [Steroidobacteraceae bacterium]
MKPLAMPHDSQAETAVLGSVLLDSECWAVAAELLRAGDFYVPRNGEVWRAMAALMKSGSAIDMVLLTSQLRQSGRLEQAGGEEYLFELTAVIPTVEHTEQMAKRVAELATIRDVVRVALGVAQEGSGSIEDVADYLDRATIVIGLVTERRVGQVQVAMLGELLHESYAELARRQSQGQTLIGHATGYTDLDHSLGGFASGDLIVLAGRPGMGKTALANGLKLGVARNSGMTVLSLELEMNREQISHRVFSSETDVDLQRLRKVQLAHAEFSRLANAAERLTDLPVAVITRRDTKISELRTAARKLGRERGGLSMVVVDYLQLVRPERREQNREIEVAGITKALKSLAGELDCPVVALSQLNRGLESRSGNDKRPRLSDLRESGAIEQDADTVLFIHRDDQRSSDPVPDDIAEIIIGKQRSGAVGVVRLRWVKEFTRFENLYAPAVAQAELGYDNSSNGNARGERWQ